MAPSPDGSQLATCGWDGAVLLWRTGKQLADQADEAAAAAAAAAGAGADADGAGAADGKHKKKRKVKGEEGTAVAVAVPEALDVRQPAAVLQGHLHCVAAAAWPSATALYTAGWDHSVRGKEGRGVRAAWAAWATQLPGQGRRCLCHCTYPQAPTPPPPATVLCICTVRQVVRSPSLLSRP